MDIIAPDDYAEVVTDSCESKRCILALEDGTVLIGTHFGGEGTQTGEVVFNTSMTGYQEILTDPSYCGQIVTMTYPHIGNYGINAEDVESSKPHVAGFVIKELARRHSNYRATLGLDEYLAQNNIIGIQGVDTRALTTKLRLDGAMRGLISTQIEDFAECVRLARESPSMAGADLVKVVAPRDCCSWTEGLNPRFSARSTIDNRKSAIGNPHVVAVDCGMKRNILRHLVDIGCHVRVVPPTLTAEEILAAKPDGVFVSNGPGDPAVVHYAIDMLKGIMG
ncbi:MAG: carbamoyl phosphate synthase small subunit, partial [Planctomycetota bacterium]